MQGQGPVNTFEVDARTDSGKPAQDGRYVFFTETFKEDEDGVLEWVSDGGEAFFVPHINRNLCPLQEDDAQPAGQYIGAYMAYRTGLYKTAVSQLLPGGLDARFWQNQWLDGSPIVHRVDPQLSFNWGLSPLTSFGPGPVSARWTGKLLGPATETFNIFFSAKGGVRFFLDHELIIDAWEDNLRAAKERMVLANLVRGTYHDIVVEYKEEGGHAALQMMWKSDTVAPSLIPASALFYAAPMSGSPFNTVVDRQGDDPPYTDTAVNGEERGQIPVEEGSRVIGKGKDTCDGAAPALATRLPDFPAVEPAKALPVGVERPRPRLLGLPAPAEVMYGPSREDVPVIASGEGFTPAPTSDLERQLVPHATRPVCGLKDAMVLTVVSWLGRPGSEVWQATPPLRPKPEACRWMDSGKVGL
eukprot:jgi/Undpi1/3248/HiC_scaffold_15.g06622.m1